MITNVEKFQEKFEKDFQKYLTPANTFYLNTKGVSNSNAISVNIPQYLTQIEGATDVDSPFAEYQKWQEGNKVVTQSKFRSKTSYIDDVTEYFTAQDMRMDAMQSLKDYMDTVVGNYAAFKMASTSAATQVKTSGTATRPSALNGSTQTVKKITLDDLLEVRAIMGKSNLSGKWYAVMDSVMITDLLSIPEITDYDKTGAMTALADGKPFPIFGITIFERHAKKGANVAYGTVSPNIDELKNVYAVPGTATDAVATTDVAGAIIWNENALYANRGLVKTYISEADADVNAARFNALYTFGLDKIREDEVGVISLIETVA